jgi:hypothetical protein
MNGRRLGLATADLPALAAGTLAIGLLALLSLRVGHTLSLGFLVVVGLFALFVTAFVVVPHIAVAVMIPVFALLPTLKVLAFPWLGPLKDLITVAAIAAAGLLLVQRGNLGQRLRGDPWVYALAGALIALYFVNLGGSLERDAGWLHGTRLTVLPLLLLLAGMTLGSRRTLRWAVASLVATAVFVAGVGLLQQAVGADRLFELGYEWDLHIRTFDGRLRSFGTLDDPFAYSALLMFGFASVLMWLRRTPLAFAAGGIIVAGLAVSYVRSAMIIAFTLLGVWLARKRQTTGSVFLLAFAAVVSAIVLGRSAEATEGRTVRAGPSFFLTVNGRTDTWSTVGDQPGSIPFGRGVGEVGTAADRATYQVSRSADEAREAEGAVVDSGYLAVVLDIGLIGLALLLAIYGRLVAVSLRAERAGSRAAALALGLLAIMILDPLARESLTGFPTAFFGWLLIGLATSAALEDTEAADQRAEARNYNPRPAGLPSGAVQA